MYKPQQSKNVTSTMLMQLRHILTMEEKVALKDKIIKDIEKI